MGGVRADGLTVGDRVVRGGVTWEVVTVEPAGKSVRLGMSAPGRGTVSGVVKAKDRFELVPAQAAATVEGQGQQWDGVVAVDEPVVELLGARLIGVEVEGGKLVVPPVDDSTILGHLVSMHGVRFDGVRVADAKGQGRVEPRPLVGADLRRAFETHHREHENFAGLSRPHWHREKAPR